MEGFLAKKAALDKSGGYYDAFMSLREDGELFKKQAAMQDASKAQNLPKNRYKDILPFDDSRVKLEPFPDDPNSDYINANYILDINDHQGYIASQGPLPHTVDDFWRMLWQKQVHVLIMACREYEGIPGRMKCMRYWPVSEESDLDFGDIIVRWMSEEENEEFVIRHIQAECAGELREVVQLHYLSWPDKGVPESLESVLAVISAARGYQSENSPPFLVHCSAGCGRTGTIIVLDYVRNLILNDRVGSSLDLHAIMGRMRQQRPAMVQTPEQYRLVYKGVEELFRLHYTQSGAEEGFYANVDLRDLNGVPETSSIHFEPPTSPAPAPNHKPSLPATPKPTIASMQPKFPNDKMKPATPTQKANHMKLRPLPSKPVETVEPVYVDTSTSVNTHAERKASVDHSPSNNGHSQPLLFAEPDYADPDTLDMPVKSIAPKPSKLMPVNRPGSGSTSSPMYFLATSVVEDYADPAQVRRRPSVGAPSGGNVSDSSDDCTSPPPPVPTKTEASAEAYSYVESKEVDWKLGPSKHPLSQLLNTGPMPAAPVRNKNKKTTPSSPEYEEVSDFSKEIVDESAYVDVDTPHLPPVSPTFSGREITFRGERIDFPKRVSGKPKGERHNPFRLSGKDKTITRL